MTDEATRTLFHMLGLDPDLEKLHAYRNHFVAGPGHHDNGHLAELVEAGLVVEVRRPGFLADDDQVYMATDEGKAFAMREATARIPKLTRSQRRYRDWLEYDCGLSFGEFIRLKRNTIA